MERPHVGVGDSARGQEVAHDHCREDEQGMAEQCGRGREGDVDDKWEYYRPLPRGILGRQREDPRWTDCDVGGE